MTLKPQPKRDSYPSIATRCSESLLIPGHAGVSLPSRTRPAAPQPGLMQPCALGRLSEMRCAAVFLLLDVSYSMEGAPLAEAKEGAAAFARDAMQAGYAAGLITFSSEAALVVPRTQDLAAMSRAIQRLDTGTSTAMAPPLDMARRELQDRGGLPGAVVLVTDGEPQDEDATLMAAQRVKRAGIDIITIGVQGANLGFLRKLASRESLAELVTVKQLRHSIQQAARRLPALPAAPTHRRLTSE